MRIDVLQPEQVPCLICGLDRAGDLSVAVENPTDSNTVVHFQRMKAFKLDPIAEAHRVGINVYTDKGEIRSDIHEFIRADFIYYDVYKCIAKGHVAVTITDE